MRGEEGSGEEGFIYEIETGRQAFFRRQPRYVSNHFTNQSRFCPENRAGDLNPPSGHISLNRYESCSALDDTAGGPEQGKLSPIGNLFLTQGRDRPHEVLTPKIGEKVYDRYPFVCIQAPYREAC
jgi:hypothetical protein